MFHLKQTARFSVHPKIAIGKGLKHQMPVIGGLWDKPLFSYPLKQNYFKNSRAPLIPNVVYLLPGLSLQQ
jgi:hypothetical protein